MDAERKKRDLAEAIAVDWKYVRDDFWNELVAQTKREERISVALPDVRTRFSDDDRYKLWVQPAERPSRKVKEIQLRSSARATAIKVTGGISEDFEFALSDDDDKLWLKHNSTFVTPSQAAEWVVEQLVRLANEE